MKPTVLGFVGPTASGKSSLALKAAEALDGEIVSMDSMQVYIGMDIGTAKASRQEQELVPHHMIDIVAPQTPFSVAEYQRLAREAVEDIHRRGKLPVLCGGTGLYLRALSRDMAFGDAQKDITIRERYQQLALAEGNEAVHRILWEKDPKTAKQLHPNNLRRIIRALEVLEITGKPMSAQQMPKDEDGPYDMRLYACAWPRAELYERINARADRMLAQGLLREVKTLMDAQVDPQAQSMQGLGYKELVPYLKGSATLKDAMDTMQRRTRNYAKRQMTWFTADERITWLNCRDSLEKQLDKIKKDLNI
ncbi:MAG: tRNA (adenosine(37)-N6)-dimethylallyltransferase MiaA [Clostridiales bacterium]|nr:tRNA (adenosine(37)-N6)-dimethylallyltransferase MiaA [Clostridiales bacterium]